MSHLLAHRKSTIVSSLAAGAVLLGLASCTAILGDFDVASQSEADAGPDGSLNDGSNDGSNDGTDGTTPAVALSAPLSVFVQAGQTANVPITLHRTVDDAPATIAVTGLPANVSAATLTLPGGTATGDEKATLVLTATTAATLGAVGTASISASTNGAHADPVTMRVTVSGPPGSVDTTFPATLPFDPSLGTVDDAVVLPDGKLLLFGTFHQSAGDAPALVVRVNADATIDSSFTVGAIATSASASPIAAGIVGLVQPDGKILVAWLQGASSVLHVTRLTPGGALDATWHDPTTATVSTSDPFPVGSPQIVPFTLTGDGSVVTAQVLDSSNVQAWRFTSAGALDPTLGSVGNYGNATFTYGDPANSFSTSASTGTSIFELATGNFIWLGDGTGTGSHFSGQVIGRTTSAFVLDTTFGPSGNQHGWEWGNRFNDLMGESVLAGDTIYTAVQKGGGGCVTDVDFCLSAWKLGANDATTGVGICPDTTTGLGCSDAAVRIAHGPNGTLLVAGFSSTLSLPVAARFTIGPPLAVDTTFGTNGVAKLRGVGGASAIETPVAIVSMPDGTTMVFNHDTQYPIQRLWP